MGSSSIRERHQSPAITTAAFELRFLSGRSPIIRFLHALQVQHGDRRSPHLFLKEIRYPPQITTRATSFQSVSPR